MDRRGRTVWSRIDESGWSIAAVITGYLAAVVAITALIAAFAAVTLAPALEMQLWVWSAYSGGSELQPPFLTRGISPPVVGVTAALVFVILAAAVLQVVFALRGGKRARMLKSMDARSLKEGEAADTKHALYEMSIAVGRKDSPALYVLYDQAVNATIIGESVESCAAVVTWGFTVKLSEADQRAAFAHLFARLRFKRSQALLLLSALLVPIRRLDVLDRWGKAFLWRDRTRPMLSTTRAVTMGAILIACVVAGPLVLFFALPMAIALALAALAAWIADQVMYRAYIDLAEFGDAEGMTLLGDPQEMLAALDRILCEDNEVPAARSAYALFYCWPGEVPPVAWDPERERIERLRELVGAEGLP